MSIETARKLVALAADVRGNPNERANAAIKACEMIAKESLLNDKAPTIAERVRQAARAEQTPPRPSATPFSGAEEFFEYFWQQGPHVRETPWEPKAKKPDAQVEDDRRAQAARDSYEERLRRDDPVRASRDRFRKGFDGIDWGPRFDDT